MGTTLEENLTGVRIVKAFSRQKEESQKFSTQAKELYGEQMNAARQMAFNMPLMTFLLTLPTALILWYGGSQIIAGSLTVGTVNRQSFDNESPGRRLRFTALRLPLLKDG